MNIEVTQTAKSAPMVGIKLMPAKITAKSYKVALSPECYARLARLNNQVMTSKWKGGWQTLIRDLWSQVTPLPANEDPKAPVATIEISESFLHRLIPPAVRYESGGYQQVVRWILCCLLDQHRVSILGTPQTLKTMMKGEE